METIEHKNIYEAIAAVMQTVGYVQKTRGKDVPFTFAGEAALIKAIRPAMVENGIMVHPAGVRDLTIEQYANKNGTLMTRVCGIFGYTFHHGPSDTSFYVEVIGEGVDSSDKAANKAMTGGFKYALRQTFMIETGDDPDTFDPSEYERGPSVRGAKPKTQKPAQPAPAQPAEPVAATTDVPKTGHGPNAQHWTKTQDWKQFWGYVKGELKLTEDEAHAALGVAHVKEYLGEKKQAMDLLIGYADAKAQEQAEAFTLGVAGGVEP